ncbi:hypothetical protein EYF80_039352 [Liparis tanakae]|uniref:Uncharacterized protein n=1 Tax=Liparis tanakae TaxID=230148 RepID=A0A4Z2GA21_9TELE|nr:hypothetical protein EYF80_039352 [Liparis tanakae]
MQLSGEHQQTVSSAEQMTCGEKFPSANKNPAADFTLQCCFVFIVTSDALVFGFITSPVGSGSSVTFTVSTSGRLTLPALLEKQQPDNLKSNCTFYPAWDGQLRITSSICIHPAWCVTSIAASWGPPAAAAQNESNDTRAAHGGGGGRERGREEGTFHRETSPMMKHMVAAMGITAQIRPMEGL